MQNRILRKENNQTPISQQEHASICALNCTITSLNWDIAFEIFCWGSRIELSCWLYRHVAGGVERLCSSSRDSPLSLTGYNSCASSLTDCWTPSVVLFTICRTVIHSSPPVVFRQSSRLHMPRSPRQKDFIESSVVTYEPVTVIVTSSVN